MSSVFHVLLLFIPSDVQTLSVSITIFKTTNIAATAIAPTTVPTTGPNTADHWVTIDGEFSTTAPQIADLCIKWCYGDNMNVCLECNLIVSWDEQSCIACKDFLVWDVHPDDQFYESFQQYCTHTQICQQRKNYILLLMSINRGN